MDLVNEFQAMVHSLGEHVVDYIGREYLAAVTIAADELTGTAEVAIVLDDQSWAAEQRAIDKMLDIRGLFLDDLSFDYRFDTTAELSHSSSTKAPTLQFA